MHTVVAITDIITTGTGFLDTVSVNATITASTVTGFPRTTFGNPVERETHPESESMPVGDLQVESYGQGGSVLPCSAVFLAVAVVAALLGFVGLSALALSMAKVCLLLFLVLVLEDMINGRNSIQPSKDGSTPPSLPLRTRSSE